LLKPIGICPYPGVIFRIGKTRYRI